MVININLFSLARSNSITVHLLVKLYNLLVKLTKLRVLWSIFAVDIVSKIPYVPFSHE